MRSENKSTDQLRGNRAAQVIVTELCLHMHSEKNGFNSQEKSL